MCRLFLPLPAEYSFRFAPNSLSSSIIGLQTPGSVSYRPAVRTVFTYARRTSLCSPPACCFHPFPNSPFSPLSSTSSSTVSTTLSCNNLITYLAPVSCVWVPATCSYPCVIAMIFPPRSLLLLVTRAVCPPARFLQSGRFILIFLSLQTCAIFGALTRCLLRTYFLHFCSPWLPSAPTQFAPPSNSPNPPAYSLIILRYTVALPHALYSSLPLRLWTSVAPLSHPDYSLSQQIYVMPPRLFAPLL